PPDPSGVPAVPRGATATMPAVPHGAAGIAHSYASASGAPRPRPITPLLAVFCHRGVPVGVVGAPRVLDVRCVIVLRLPDHAAHRRLVSHRATDRPDRAGEGDQRERPSHADTRRTEPGDLVVEIEQVLQD